MEKNHKLDLNDKIKNYENFDKRVKEKKSKVGGLNRKILYIQIRIEGLNWKQINFNKRERVKLKNQN